MLRKLTFILIIIGVITGLGWLAGRAWYLSGGLTEFVADRALHRMADDNRASSSTKTVAETNFVKHLLGWDAPQTYLVLFLNNTELRPGGGFIGAYAVVRLANGVPEILKVAGTEALDNAAPKDGLPEPPGPIAKYLKIDRWMFRDSNWSPDFASSSRQALRFYELERGVGAGDIDMVIGFTPSLVEEFLKLTGPVTVQGQTWESKNFTEQLEYEVEYDYAKRGVAFSDRKNILGELAETILGKAARQILTHWPEYLTLTERMLAEKQVAVYAVDPEIQKIVSLKHWSGETTMSLGDYLLWSDANLGALKTDWAIERELEYRILPEPTGGYIATVTMRYNHRGKFDWRTSRYRTYARVFVPPGSALLKSEFWGEATGRHQSVPTDRGTELNRQWFGASTVIEPGKTGYLSFSYAVSPAVASQIARGAYQLRVDKQIGTISPKLTLELDFGKPLTAAQPPEVKTEQGDGKYRWQTDLRIDREFKIKLE